MKVKYYVCKHCGNIIEKVKDKGVPVISTVYTGTCFSTAASVTPAFSSGIGSPQQITGTPLSFTFSIMFPQCLHT